MASEAGSVKPMAAWLKVGAAVLRVLLAGVFVFSAVSKLLSMDSFEMYVYSYAFLPLWLVYVLVRLCIVAEFMLGVLIGTGWWPRLTRLLTVGMLVFFTLFLCYAALIGRNESCQCFGDAVDLNPVQSLLKNAVLIVVTLLVYRFYHPSAAIRAGQKVKAWAVAAATVATTVTVFAVSVPDTWYFGSGDAVIKKDRLREAMAAGGPLDEFHLYRGHKLAAFVTPGCKYCKMSRQKLNTIAGRHHIADSNIVYIEPGAENSGYLPSDSRTNGITTDLFLQITRGNRPYLVLLEDGEPLYVFHYRNISERKIAGSLAGR